MRVPYDPNKPKRKESTIDLLSCPFCGTTDVEGGPYPASRNPDTWYIIDCGNPGCKVRMEGSSVEDVVGRWNRTAPARVMASKT